MGEVSGVVRGELRGESGRVHVPGAGAVCGECVCGGWGGGLSGDGEGGGRGPGWGEGVERVVGV